MAESRDAAARAAETLLRAGETAARSFAEAVSGQAQPGVSGEPPLAGIVRHTTSGLAGIARIMMDAARAPAAAEQVAAAPRLPAVAPGGTLRVPLSIDNRGQQPMEAMAPKVLGALHEGEGAAPHAVRFTPKKLAIAPRDFEKLVVEIVVPADAAPGRWVLRFSPDGTPESAGEIAYIVSPAASPAA